VSWELIGVVGFVRDPIELMRQLKDMHLQRNVYDAIGGNPNHFTSVSVVIRL
jgi:hypothetical protein